MKMKWVYTLVGMGVVGFAAVDLASAGKDCGAKAECQSPKVKAAPCGAVAAGKTVQAPKAKCGTKADCGVAKKHDCPSELCASKDKEKDEFVTVDTATLKQWLDDEIEIQLVDARSGEWDDGRRIAGAIQLASDADEETIATALPDKAASLVVYCSNTKCPAGAKLAKRLVKLGYTGVVKYPEGIDGWVEAGFEVSEDKP